MATNSTVTATVNVVTPGLANAVNQSAQVHNNLQSAAAAATRIRVPQAVQAAHQGVAASNANRAPSGSPSGTNLSRGLAGQTGAEGRDFAKQAQGLGGLVHVYATFAANIFAVSAAFGALSRAADTTNMVKGLDQLGASSGRALGSLSKQLASVSDGAISFRDAMTSVAQASSGGMTNAAILRMGNVAKQASQALGIAMPDAISRLTRGIVKLEPELLDEIGIMVRLDKSSQDYARSLGKSVSALTDFEKRQGFANAVLEQGEKKFGAIKIDANPYAKILASMENIAHTGLELVNKVISPLTSFLSTSPTGLALAIGGLASVLLKQAIPAIGMFRENAKRMADETHARVTRQVAEQQDAAAHYDTIAAMSAEKAYTTEAGTIKRIDALRKQQFDRKIVGAEVRGALRKSPFELSDADIDRITSKRDQLEASLDASDKKQADKLSKRLLDIKAFHAERSVIGDAAAEASERSDDRMFSHAKLQESRLAKLKVAAAKSSILSSAADNAATLGPTIAFQQLKEQVNSLDASSFTKKMTTIRGSISIATTYASNLLGVLGTWGMVVGAAVGAISLLDSWLTTTAKEAEQAANSLKLLEDAIVSADLVIAGLASKDPLEKFSTASIEARATAMLTLADTTSKALIDTKNQIAKTGIWDSISEGWKLAFGVGVQDKAAKELAGSVTKVLELGLPGPAMDKFKATLAKLLNIDPKDTAALNKAIKMENVGRLAPLLTAAMKEVSNATQGVASLSSTLDSSFSTAGKTFDTIIASSAPTDNLAKLGEQYLKLGIDMQKALDEPIVAMSKLADISGDTAKLKLLSPEFSAELIKASPFLKDAVTSVALLKDDIAKAESSKVTLINEKNKLLAAPNYNQNIQDAIGIVDAKLRKTEATLKYASTNLKAHTDSIDPYLKKMDTEVINTFARGADLVARSIGIEFEKAQITISKAFAGTLSGSQGGIDATARLDTQALRVQMSTLDINMSMAKSLENIRVSSEAAAIALERKALVPGSPTYAADAKALDSRELSNKISKGILEGGSKNVLGDIQGYLKSLVPEVRVAARDSLDYASKIQAGQAAKAQVSAQIKAVDVTKQSSTVSMDIAKEKDLLAIRQATLTTEKAVLDARSSGSLYITKDLALEKAANTEAAAQYAILVSNKDLEEQKRKAQITIDSPMSTVADKKNAETTLTEVKIKSINKLKREEEELKARGLSTSEALMSAEKSKIEFILAGKKQEQAVEASKTSAIIASEESVLAIKNATGALPAGQLEAETALLDVKKEQVRSAEAIKTLGIDSSAEQDLLRLRLTSVSLSKEERDVITAKISSNEASYKQSLEGENQVTAAKIRLIEVQGTVNTLLAQQNEQMDRMKSTTESLTTLFGEMGANIGLAGEAMTKMAQDEEKYQKDRASIVDIGGDTTEIDKKNTTKKIANLGKVASTTKKMFKEDTLAYKVLDGMEKASAAMKLVNDIKEMASTAQLVATTIAGMFTTATVATTTDAAQVASGTPVIATNAAKSITAAGSGDPYSGIFRVIAMMALMAAVTGMSFGGGGASGASASSIPEPITYATGIGGVLGDDEAMNTALADSLSILTDLAKPELALTSKMQKSLANIDDSMVGFLSAVSSTSGTGAASLGSSSSINTEGAGFFSSMGVAGDMLLTGMGGIVATIGTGIESILGGLFGGGGDYGGTSTTSYGIDIKQQSLNAAAMLTAVNNFATTYTEIQHDRTWWQGGGSWKEVYSTATTGVTDAKVQQSLTNISAGILAAYEEVAKSLNLDTSIVGKQTLNIGKINQMGLTAVEFSDVVGAEFGKFTDTIAVALIPNINLFTKKGESAGTTIIRLASALEEAEYFTTKLGISSITYTDIINKRGDLAAEIVRQSIVNAETFAGTVSGVGIILNNLSGSASDMSDTYTSLLSIRDMMVTMGQGLTGLNSGFLFVGGGIDKLSNTMSNYYDNFYSEKERLDINIAKAGKTLRDAGLVITDAQVGASTIASYRALVEAQGEVTSSNSKLIVAMMEAGDIIKDIADNGLAKVLEDLKAMQAGVAEAFQSIKNTATTAAANLVKAQEAITNGYVTAQSKLSAAQKAAADKMLGFAKTIRDAIAGLNTNTDTLAIVQSRFDTTATAALAGDATALSQVGALGQTMAQMAKEGSASQADFLRLNAYVANTLDTIATSQETQAAAMNVTPELTSAEIIMQAQLDVAKWSQAAATAGVATSVATDQVAVTIAKYLDELQTAKVADTEASATLAAAIIASNGINLTLATTLDKFISLVEKFRLAAGTAGVAVGTISPTLQSFAVGTDYVPNDMIAQIHKGEKIVPAAFNRNENTNAELVAEIRTLRVQMAVVMQKIADSTEKTKTVLVRATRDGEAMVTTAV